MCGRDIFGLRIRSKAIECIWMHNLMIHIDTKGLILKKAWEETIWNV